MLRSEFHNYEILLTPNAPSQGERWERVDCKLEQRRGYSLVSLLRPTCVLWKFAGDMSHCPSRVNNEQTHCCGLFNSKR
jgi:hypothetical protein